MPISSYLLFLMSSKFHATICSRNNLIPLCHPTLCDYELSRYDISSIPLQRRISDLLLLLAKGQQQPQCHFYIDENEDFYEHIDLCRDLRRCKYCFCPYSIDQIKSHSIQCRNDKSSQNEKLTNFIMNKTKYPITKEQIHFFIQQKKTQNQVDLDPLSIIDELAIFGNYFSLFKFMFMSFVRTKSTSCSR
jgi:hypothetical protein